MGFFETRKAVKNEIPGGWKDWSIDQSSPDSDFQFVHPFRVSKSAFEFISRTRISSGGNHRLARMNCLSVLSFSCELGVRRSIQTYADSENHGEHVKGWTRSLEDTVLAGSSWQPV
ncbi:MAG: hypothetical protein DWH81_07635 [Planctomycetota bacterium]|nr:MAG: hypothetical protein DWH81_07635 [Planctomycetota bacterium]